MLVRCARFSFLNTQLDTLNVKLISAIGHLRCFEFKMRAKFVYEKKMMRMWLEIGSEKRGRMRGT